MDSYVIVRGKGVILSSQAVETEIVRPISSREELEELIDRMPFIQTIQVPNNKIRKDIERQLNEF